MSDAFDARPEDSGAPQGGERSPPRRSSRSPSPRRRDSRSPPRRGSRSPSPRRGGEEGHKLYIGNLDFRTSDSDLRHHFSRFGELLDVFIPKNRNSENRGFGFVTFRDRRDAETAELETNNRDFDGRVIQVNFARPRPPKSSYSSSSYSRGRSSFREVCRDFQNNRCSRGDSCRFSHEDDDRGGRSRYRSRSRSRSPPRRSRYRSRSRSRSPRYRSRSRSPGRR